MLKKLCNHPDLLRLRGGHNPSTSHALLSSWDNIYLNALCRVLLTIVPCQSCIMEHLCLSTHLQRASINPSMLILYASCADAEAEQQHDLGTVDEGFHALFPRGYMLKDPIQSGDSAPCLLIGKASPGKEDKTFRPLQLRDCPRQRSATTSQRCQWDSQLRKATSEMLVLKCSLPCRQAWLLVGIAAGHHYWHKRPGSGGGKQHSRAGRSAGHVPGAGPDHLPHRWCHASCKAPGHCGCFQPPQRRAGKAVFPASQIVHGQSCTISVSRSICELAGYLQLLYPNRQGASKHCSTIDDILSCR